MVEKCTRMNSMGLYLAKENCKFFKKIINFEIIKLQSWLTAMEIKARILSSHPQVRERLGQHSQLTKTKIFNFAGELGRWQIFVCGIIFLLKFPVAWHQLGTIFLAPTLDFKCSDPALSKCNPQCPEHVFNTTIFSKTIQMV